MGRKLAAPKVTLKLEEADEGVLDAAGAEARGEASADKDKKSPRR
jgi:hypothetical protein